MAEVALEVGEGFGLDIGFVGRVDACLGPRFRVKDLGTLAFSFVPRLHFKISNEK